MISLILLIIIMLMIASVLKNETILPYIRSAKLANFIDLFLTESVWLAALIAYALAVLIFY